MSTLRAAVLMIATIIGAILLLALTADAAQLETSCTDELGQPGLLNMDRCVTVEIYNETFSAAALELVPSLAFPGRSVAEVYDLRVGPPLLDAADRPRVFMGVPEPSFAELVARAADAFDNPALEGI